MKKSKITATTVKIDDDLYTEFKVLAVRRHITLQKFMEKCLHLFVEDKTFRGIVDSFTVSPQLSTTGAFSITVITSSNQPAKEENV
jgi:hypothetical protein